MSKRYSVNFRTGQPHDLNKADFDRLRKMTRLFSWKANRPTRLTIKPEYTGWIEDKEFRFQEKLTGRVTRFVRSPEDSCARVERLCAHDNPNYIRDPELRDREIARQYA